MSLSKFILIIFLAMACGKHKSSKSITTPAIAEKASLYCELSKPEYERNKFVVDECDGAGFTSLYELACPSNAVDLSVFQSSDGEMFRNPSHDCYPTKSSSGFSKDHVLMRLVAAVGQKDRSWPQGFIDYIDSHGGWFCDAVDNATRLSRCYISPFLYEYLSKAAGNYSIVSSGDAWFEKDGFEAHLQVLGIWVKGKLDGSISSVDLDYLKAYARREPLNALYQSVAFRYGVATFDSVLAAFGSSHWPSDRLPDSRDHCSSYLFQRDMSSKVDWEPCPDKNEVYSGTDYSFAAYVLAN